MIARQWRGWAPRERAREYLNLFATMVQAKLSAVQGYRRSLVLVRELDEETEIVTITFFDRLEDIAAFAGDRYEVANVSPEARAILSHFDETVSHFEVALELPQPQ
jgi:heme-degrading monooxygenase HmoA